MPQNCIWPSQHVLSIELHGEPMILRTLLTYSQSMIAETGAGSRLALDYLRAVPTGPISRRPTLIVGRLQWFQNIKHV